MNFKVLLRSTELTTFLLPARLWAVVSSGNSPHLVLQHLLQLWGRATSRSRVSKFKKMLGSGKTKARS